MKKISSVLEKAVYLFFAAMIAAILTLNIFFSNNNYACKKEFLLPNIVLLILALFVLSIICAAIWKLQKKHESMHKGKYRGINIASALLLFLLLYISLNIYFYSGWDAEGIFKNAKLIAQGQGESINDSYYFSHYFSWFPNQHFVLMVEAVLLKINNRFGVIDTNEGLYFIIAFQCVLYALAGNVLYRMIDDYSSNRLFAWLGWIFFCLLVAVSGWVAIPYTDEMSLIFPVLILRCFQRKEAANEKQKLKWWIFISLLSYWGFKMKPTVLIMLIAILLGEALYGIRALDKSGLKKAIKVIVTVALCFIVSNSAFKCAFSKTKIVIHDELNTGVLHMMMMGLKNESDGIWNYDEVAFSTGIADKQERREAQIHIIKQRLADYGLKGLLRHTARKSLVIFNDGTFAWGKEGEFYKHVYEEKNEFMSPLLRDLFYSSGQKYKILSTVEQAIWLAVLFLSGLCLWAKKDKVMTVIVVSLIGIILFNYLFEARARYVMIYAPIFICAAMIALKQIAAMIGKKSRHCGAER